MKEHILFKLATRSRPEKARASINNIIEKLGRNEIVIHSISSSIFIITWPRAFVSSNDVKIRCFSSP